jgi:hypothetical protein
VQIHYPHDPRAGHTVRVVGRREHSAERFLIVCQADGTRAYIPEWMTRPEAAQLAFRTAPRLPLASLLALCGQLDSLLSLLPDASTSQEEVMKRRKPLQIDLFTTTPTQAALQLPQLNHSQVMVLLVKLLDDVMRAEDGQPPIKEARDEQDQC